MVYQDWHEEIEKPRHQMLQLARLVGTNNVSPKLVQIVTEIHQRRLDMAHFLCEKVANEGKIGLKDARLLLETAGIYWFAIEGEPRHTQDPAQLLKRLASEFSRDWRDGKFAQASVNVRVQALCKALESKQGDYVIDPDDLLPIRRNGIYAIPELIRQIQLNNSNHAFAVLLILHRDSQKYGSYIENVQQEFVSKTDKMTEVKKMIEQFKQGAPSESELVKLMVKAAMLETNF